MKEVSCIIEWHDGKNRAWLELTKTSPKLLAEYLQKYGTPRIFEVAIDNQETRFVRLLPETAPRDPS